MWDYLQIPSLLPSCDNNSDAVREKDDALKRAQEARQDLEEQLKENKRALKSLRKERDALLHNSKFETSSTYASTVVTTTGNDEADLLRVDLAAYKTRILELESRAKTDKHQIIALQIRLDQLLVTKGTMEKALLASDNTNARLEIRCAEFEKLFSENASDLQSSSSCGSRTVPVQPQELSRPVSLDSHECLRVPTPTPRTMDHSPNSVVAASTYSLDSKDLENIRVVNRFLRKLADDVEFQAKLKKDTVRWAFVYWSGGDVSSIEHKAGEIKKCEVVRSIYPVLDSFESVCIQSNIKIPLDHVAQGKAALDDTVLISTFGITFCENHNLLQGPAGVPPKGWLFNY